MLLEMFFIFFKIGAFTFGGGYAMIPIIQKELVEKRKWIEEEDFLDALVVAQSSPGPVAVNISIYAGNKVAGKKGALVAVLGTILPSFLIILVVVKYLYEYRNHQIVDKAFKGITPTVVALIASAVYKLIKSSEFGIKGLVFSLMAFLIIAIFNVSAIYLIIGAAVISIVYNKVREDK